MKFLIDENVISQIMCETDQSLEESKPKKTRLQKSKNKTMLISFYDFNGAIHKEFGPNSTSVNAQYYLGVSERLFIVFVLIIEHQAVGVC